VVDSPIIYRLKIDYQKKVKCGQSYKRSNKAEVLDSQRSEEWDFGLGWVKGGALLLL
jgi:hypothetical protein